MFLAFLAVVNVVNLTALLIPATVAGALFLGLSRGETALWFANAAVVANVGVATGTLVFRNALRPLRVWGAGDHSDPAGLLSALLRLPQLAGVSMSAITAVLLLTVSYPYALWLARPDASAAVALFVSYLVVGVTAAMLSTTTLQHLIGAPAIALGSVAGASVPPHFPWWTLRWRLVITIGLLCGFAPIVITGAVLGTSAQPEDYLFVVAISGAWGLFMAWLVSLVMVGPLLTPLDEMIEGAARIERGDLSEAVPVLAADELGDLAAAFNSMQRGLREREALHAAFGSYVDPLLAQRLVESGSAVFEGEELDVTVLFADVRSFTSYSERVSPAEAVTLLNRLFDVIVPILHEHGGHANHYLGDGLLAVFGEPQPMVGHADAAVAAAVQIQRAVAAEFGDDLRVGIGVNTGAVIAGTVGGGGRHEFTVIGDTVNTAARVEQLTKETGDAVLITAATRRAMSTPRVRMKNRGEFSVRGKTNRVGLYAVGSGRTAEKVAERAKDVRRVREMTK